MYPNMRSYLPLALAALATSFICAPTLALQTEVYAHSESYSYSEVAPIKQFGSSLEGPMIDKGSVALSTNTVSTGQSFQLKPGAGVFHLALFNRVDYSLKFSHDTALLLYANENNTQLDDKIHDVYLQANHIDATGLSVAYSGETVSNISYRVNLAYMYAREMIYGGVSGELSSFDADAQGNLDLNYFYSEDVFFDREKSEYSATGYALDLELNWQATDRFSVGFVGKDLISSIRWTQQQTTATATTDRVSTDANGNTNVRAVLSWQELDGKVNQRLPLQYKLTETYTLTSQDSVMLEQFNYDGTMFHRLGYRRNIYKLNSEFSAFYDITTEAYGFAFNMRYLGLGFTTDNFDFDKAKVLGVNLAVRASLKL